MLNSALATDKFNHDPVVYVHVHLRRIDIKLTAFLLLFVHSILCSKGINNKIHLHLYMYMYVQGLPSCIKLLYSYKILWCNNLMNYIKIEYK